MTKRTEYRITFSSNNFNAFATIEIKAYTEAQAVEMAEKCLSNDFAPRLHHIAALNEVL